jgi:DNA polymerase-3 subunit gamma/tau
MQLTEKYRPRQWSEVIAQEKVVTQLCMLAKRGQIGGESFLLTGGSGTGKTTIAYLIAREIADDFAIEEIDASNCTSGYLRELEQSMHLSGFGKGGRAYIINEAHGLRKDALRQLLVLLERIPQHVTIIFTTTNDGEEQLFEDNIDAGPLLSRCICLNLARRDLAKPFAERAAQIAQAENLGSAPLANIVRLVQTHRNNFRAVLKAIQNGELLA